VAVRSGKILMMAVTVSIVLATIVFFPVAIYHFASRDLDWPFLSQVGEAYGGASALLSALAIWGVVASLILQYRQHRAAVLHNLGQRHYDLVRFTVEHPAFAVSWGEDSNVDDYEYRSFCNLIMTHWLTLWRLREFDERSLRASCDRLFRNRVPRLYWAEVGEKWIAAPTQRERRFLQVVNASFAAADAAGPADREPGGMVPPIANEPFKAVEPGGAHLPLWFGASALAAVAFTAGFVGAKMGRRSARPE
jgi:hypothetical protein